ncbi:structural maintenance of chromosomes protein 5 [Pancytospora philotis]|nr:structural maintenance of chromosomes protein 5 [Pancytospora philotis]
MYHRLIQPPNFYPMAKYKHGNIVSIALSNFQIFEEQTFRFEPALNLIAAPNGSGKSSIANAMAFVLSGAPRTIGKSKELAEFIRFGAAEAAITAEVWIEQGAPGKVVTLHRAIKLSSRASRYTDGQAAVSSFYIDGQLTAPREYAAALKVWGIDVDSLCTFLPQERVAEFTAMDPAMLLEETLRNSGISTARVYDLAEQLGALDSNVALRAQQKRLVEGTISRMEAGMEAVREREALQRRLDALQYKLLRVMHDQMRNNYITVKNAAGAIEKQLELAADEAQRATAQMHALESSPLLSEHNERLAELEGQNTAIERIATGIKERTRQIEYKRVDNEGLRAKAAKRNEELIAGTKRARDLERELCDKSDRFSKIVGQLGEKIRRFYATNEEALPVPNLDRRLETAATFADISPLVPSASQFDGGISGLRDRLRQAEYHAHQAQAEIEKLEQKLLNHAEERTQRMELLKKYHRDTATAVQWLAENKEAGFFKDEVLEPSFLHISIDPRYAQEIETLLSFQSLSSFLVRNSRDFVTLSRKLKDEMKLNINIAEVVDASAKLTFLDRGSLRRYGIDGLAYDFVQADEAYKRLLCVYSHFNTIPIAKKAVDEIKFFEENPESKRMVANGQYVEIRKLNNAVNTRNNWIITSRRVSARGIFNAQKVDVAEIRGQLERLRADRERRRLEVTQLITEMQERTAKQVELRKEFDLHDLESLDYTIVSLKAQIMAGTQEMEAVSAGIEETNRAIRENEKAEAEIIDFIDAQCTELEELLCPKKIPVFNLDKIKGIRLDLENYRRMLKIAELRLETEKVELDKYKMDALALREKIEGLKEDIRKCPLHDLYRKQAEDEQSELVKLEELPDSVDELHVEIRLAGGRLEVLGERRGVLESFEKKSSESRALAETLGELEVRREKLVAEIEEHKDMLLQQVQDFIAPADELFQQMFKRLGFTGKLSVGTEQKYTLNIMVRFREHEELQQLSSFRQSGGEKALSTVLFLLALQQSKPAPFRLVDEINQGMDAINEKAVFDIVREMCTGSQFFVITPKLVEGLTFAHNTNVVILYGGPGITKDLEQYAGRICA